MKKHLMQVTALLLAALALFSLSACKADVPEEAESLIFLQVEEDTDGGFYGIDAEGNRWLVRGDFFNSYAYTWVRYSGAAEELTDGTARYAVTADSAWYYNGDAYDACVFDIDGDGVEEECILKSRPDTAGDMTGAVEMTVLDGSTQEYSATFTVNGALDALAFLEVDGDLQIIGVDYPYGAETWTMETYNITCQGGRLTVALTHSS